MSACTASASRGRVVAEDARLARGRPRQPGEDAQGRRLTGAVGAEEAEHGALRHDEVDAVERLRLLVLLGEARDDDRRGGRPCGLRRAAFAAFRRAAATSRTAARRYSAVRRRVRPRPRRRRPVVRAARRRRRNATHRQVDDRPGDARTGRRGATHSHLRSPSTAGRRTMSMMQKTDERELDDADDDQRDERSRRERRVCCRVARPTRPSARRRP